VTVHIEHTGELRFFAPPDEIFELFTPEGERRWAPDWAPNWIHPHDGEAHAEAVFATTNGGEETVWMVLELDANERRAKYLRMTPGSRIGVVEVACESASEGGTTVRVTYRMTALTPEGERRLAAFDAAAYAEMMAEWQRRVGEAIAAG
jgi:hypothetical protein